MAALPKGRGDQAAPTGAGIDTQKREGSEVLFSFFGGAAVVFLFGVVLPFSFPFE